MAGEITSVTVTTGAIGRNYVEATIAHTDPNTWEGAASGSFLIEYSLTGAAGPWIQPANVQVPSNHCFDLGTGNPIAPGGLTDTPFAIFDPSIPHNTPVHVRVTAQPFGNPTGGDVVVGGPATTNDYPTFACIPNSITETTATAQLGGATGRVNISSCDEDSVTWEYGTTPGGPYPNVIGPAPVDGLSPSVDLTGLTPATTYYYRARLSEQVDTGGEYLTTQECSFTTAAATTPRLFNEVCDEWQGTANPIQDVHAHLQATVDNVPTDHKIWIAVTPTQGDYATTVAHGPATPEPGDNTVGQVVDNIFYNPDVPFLNPSTQYWYRVEVRDAADQLVSASEECTFTTTALPDYQDCGGPTGAGGSVAGRNTLIAQVTRTGEAPVGNISTLLEVGTSPTGPFTTADTVSGPTCTPSSNPAGPAAGGNAWTIDNLDADTEYWLRFTMNRTGPEANPNPDVLVCGPLRTRPYPHWQCDPADNITETSADLHFPLILPPGPAPWVNLGTPPCARDVQTVRYGTTPGGPYPQSVTNPDPALASPDFSLTGLTPGTTYYYRMETSENRQTNGIYDTTVECSFTTLANQPPTLSPTDQSGPVGTELCDDVPVADVDGTVVSVTAAPPGATVTDLGGGMWRVCYTPTVVGSTTFTLTATDDDGATGTAPITFTGTAVVLPPERSFVPTPCPSCGGAGGAGGPDVEQMLLCDVLPDGTIAGTALAVYEYDEEGNPVGPPTFVDPDTGAPYTAQGTLQACADCSDPVQFCFTTTSTGPVDHPGRTYDLTLPINPGFAVDSLLIDSTTHAANIEWGIYDTDGAEFAAELQSFIEGRMPSATTTTVTNPNAGGVVCGEALPMTIHIECARLDQAPPDLVELVFNAGRDLIQNPGYTETPEADLSQPCGFHLMRRQDNANPGQAQFPPINCTNVANRGWETNDDGQTFEIWCSDVRNGQQVTPTPRGTPVQEVNSDGHPADNGTTIWQTFEVPPDLAGETFRLRLVHGARDTGETHTIRLSTGDTDATGPGDLINDVTQPPSVTNSGGPNPWTTLDETRNLPAGLYTFSFHSTAPVVQARGGLFSDMRAFVDKPGTRATAVTDDDTCVVTVDETVTVTDTQFWAPQCSAGQIVAWRNVETGEVLDNAAFWGQVPAPQGCVPPPPSEGGGSVAANLVHTYTICGIVNGAPTTLQRVVITDPSGGALLEQIIGPDGGPVAPSSWTVGECDGDQRYLADQVLCDLQPDGSTVPFLRKYVQAIDAATGRPRVVTSADFTLTGGAYTVVGIVRECQPDIADREPVCYTLTSTGATIHAGWARHQDSIPNTPQTPNGMAFFTALGVPLDPTADGFTVVPCAEPPCGPVATTGLCLADGTPIAVVMRRDCATGVVTQDGWINLTTGTFTAGPAPAGAVACGTGRSVQVSGTFCDIDTNGDVQGLVLIEYQYAPDGSISSVRLVDATTGATYTPVGEITVCPADAETEVFQHDHILCDIQADGTAVTFVRKFLQDQLGVVTNVANHTLEGAPYTPTGTVAVCPTQDCPQTLGEVCYERPDTITGWTVAPDPDGGDTWTATAPSPTYEYGDRVTSWEGRYSGNASAQWRWSAPELGGNVASSGWVPAFAGNPQPAPYVGTRVQNGITITLEVLAGALNNNAPDIFGSFNVGTRVRISFSEPVTLTVAGTSAMGDDVGEGFQEVTVARLCEARAASVRDCATGTITLYDLATGDEVDPATVCTCSTTTSTSCQDCTPLTLCDVQRDVPAQINGFGEPTEQWITLPNGVRWMRGGNDATIPNWFIAGEAALPERFSFDQPVAVTYAVRFSGPTASPIVIPDGWFLDSINTIQHSWNAATRTLSPTAGATVAGESTFTAGAGGGSEARITTMVAPTLTGPQPAGQRTDYGLITVTADVVTPFLRTLCRDCNGQLQSSTDTELDGETAYSPAGDVTVCAPTADPPAAPAAEPCDVADVLERCRCDDVNGDGTDVVNYTELFTVDCDANLASAGTFTEDLTAPYTPVNPTPCEDLQTPSEELTGVQAARVQLAPGQSWDIASEPLAQSVTVTAVTGEGTITDHDGAVSTLFTGETASWSVVKDTDQTLSGPLVIAAVSGVVTINITRGV